MISSLLERAKNATKHEFFFLKYAKFLFKTMNDYEKSLQVLKEGYETIHGSETIILALQKFYRQMDWLIYIAIKNKQQVKHWVVI